MFKKQKQLKQTKPNNKSQKQTKKQTYKLLFNGWPKQQVPNYHPKHLNMYRTDKKIFKIHKQKQKNKQNKTLELEFTKADV